MEWHHWCNYNVLGALVPQIFSRTLPPVRSENLLLPHPQLYNCGWVIVSWCLAKTRRYNIRPPTKHKTTHEAIALGCISLSNFMSMSRIVVKIWGFEFHLLVSVTVSKRYFWTVEKTKRLPGCHGDREHRAWSKSPGFQFFWFWTRATQLVTKAQENIQRKFRVKYDLRKYYFTSRIVNVCNSLSSFVVSADSVNCFKNRLDKFWSNRDIIYDYQAEIHGNGNRSEVVLW